MLREELIFVGTCDIAGQVRGKGSQARELPARKKQGIGWAHSNMMQTAFGPILDTPFGTGGDLMVVPDMSAEARVDFADGSAPEHFILGDIRKTDGSLHFRQVTLRKTSGHKKHKLLPSAIHSF